MALLVSNIVLAGDENTWHATVAAHLGLAVDQVLQVRLVRRSLDARHHKQVAKGAFKVEVVDEARVLEGSSGARLWRDKDAIRYGLIDAAPAPRSWPPGSRWIVVGAGPAGMFAALFLAEAGASVLLLERGGPVRERVKTVNAYWRGKGTVDPENNLVFGEGGAGTFSDGKIYTRRRDSDVGYVLRRFVDFGASSHILEEGWAHLGTDKVRAILPVFRERLRELGVEVRFHSRVDDVLVEGRRVVGVRVGEIEERATGVVVAAGHSARDTIRMLVRRGAAAERRPIAVGARIEHPQGLIDRVRYGRDQRAELPAASYRLAYNGRDGTKARTFCMCPGGMVVPAMDSPDRVVVNGMSFAAQRSRWANSAIIVEVQPEAYGAGGPDAGYAWQDEIERRAHDIAGGAGAAPAQRVQDLLEDTLSAELPRVSYPLGVTSVSLRQVLPAPVVKGMVQALTDFNRRMPGFVGPEAVLMAPETRTTSPIRLLRGRDFGSATLRGLYPVGEGAGYGGGIVSCALDGLRAARAIVDGTPQK